ncbi:MAG: class I SAM-dependent methyltransferase [Pseudomonadota bacterium]|nr:MAG: class I SAM-dependent methyltransferase [Pseudomonadota bacterium]
MPGKKDRKKDKHKGDKAKMAALADRHALYQRSVQAPEFEVEFFDKTFRELRGRVPLSMREDFCGTAFLSTEWCKSDARRTAIGVDMCADTLAWGTDHNLKPAGDDVARRITLVNADVREVSEPRVDITCALNFSYCVFKTRDELRSYFELAHAGLNPDGLLMLDLFGGTECNDALEEETRIPGAKAKYIWEHASFNPIDHRIVCHIHFAFKDGSRLDKAFTYDWRLWSIPELSELLQEAGFCKVRVYWERFEEGSDRKYLEGTGEYFEATEVENQESWMAYLVAER